MKDCKWITSPKATGSDNQLYYFKKEFDLKVVKEARVDISAQARYKLYINGELVGIGPCKGTREKTYFDTIDVTDCLVVGKNEKHLRGLLSHMMKAFSHRSENRRMQVYVDCNLMDER